MVIYPWLGGLIKLDFTPGGGLSAGVVLGSFGGGVDMLSFLFVVCERKKKNIDQRTKKTKVRNAK